MPYSDSAQGTTDYPVELSTGKGNILLDTYLASLVREL